MASTGKTTNYELSQFIGTDKPSWLGDYNGDMLKIDTALGSINATATTAQSGVASAQSAASAAQMTANAAQQKATANAQDITELKADFATKSLDVTEINGTTNIIGVFNNNFITIVKGHQTFSGKPSATIVGENACIPCFSVAGNIFKLSVSTINVNPIFVCPATGRVSRTGETNLVTYLPFFAYYDGANTIFYFSADSSYYSTLTSIYDIWFSGVVSVSGYLIPISD